MLRRRSPPSLIVFDLDGTLVDSAPDLADAIDGMLNRLGLPPAGETAVRGWIGNGIPMLIKRGLTGELWPAAEPPGFGAALPLFMDLYQAGVCNRSRLYPGVTAGLARVRAAGIPAAVITNKASRFTIPLLGQLGIAEAFDYVGSGDQFKKPKPDPEPLLKTAARFGVNPAESWLVGDSINDAQAARAAGFPFVAVTYGYHGTAGVTALGADAVVDSLEALPGLWERVG